MNSRWLSWFKWSHSKNELWDRCKKKFWDTYILPHEPMSSFIEKVKALKKLDKMIFWSGNIIHKTIANQLKKIRDVGMEINEDSMMSMFSSYYEAVRSNPKIHGFVEFVNGPGISEADFEAIKFQGEAAIRNFVRKVWPEYKDLELLQIEEFSNIVIDGIPVTAKIDLGTKTFDDLYRITDWKTGKDRPGEAEKSIQMTVYIMMLMEKENIPVDDIEACLCYLKTGKPYPTKRTMDQIKSVQEMIVTSGRAMMAIKSEDDCPATPGDWDCPDCNFLTICDEGKEFTGYEGTIHRTL